MQYNQNITALTIARESIEIRLSLIDFIIDPVTDLLDTDILVLDEYEGMDEEELIEEVCKLNNALKHLCTLILREQNCAERAKRTTGK